MASAEPSAPTPMRLAMPIKNTFVHFDEARPWEPLPLCRLLTWPLGSKDTRDADVVSTDDDLCPSHSWGSTSSLRSGTPPPARAVAKGGAPGDCFKALHLEPVRPLPCRPRARPHSPEAAAGEPTPLLAAATLCPAGQPSRVEEGLAESDRDEESLAESWTSWTALPGERRQAPFAESDRRQASKAMTYVLRHKAAALGLDVLPDAYLPVEQLLACRAMRRFECTVADVREIVGADPKRRFHLAEVEGVLQVRANQGHSMACVQDEALLHALGAGGVPERCVHGTYLKHWGAISERGLLAGGALGTSHRRHVHFAPGLPGRGGVVSGMRSDCEVAIYLDMGAALQAGLPLFESENGVILTPGFDGLVPTRLFERAVCLRTGAVLWPLPSEGGVGEPRLWESTPPEIAASGPSPAGELLGGGRGAGARADTGEARRDVGPRGGDAGEDAAEAPGGDRGEAAQESGAALRDARGGDEALAVGCGERVEAVGSEAWTTVRGRLSRHREAGHRAAKAAAPQDSGPLAAPACRAAQGIRGRLSASFAVGVEDDVSFRVVGRLLGPRGRRMQSVASEAGEGTRVWLCGCGTTQRGPEAERESSGPLTVCVSAPTRQGLERAASRVLDVLADVRKAHREFCEAGPRCREDCAAANARSAQARGPKSPMGHATQGTDVAPPAEHDRHATSEAAAFGPDKEKVSSLVCCLRVGIQEDASFSLVRRLLGAGGENMRFIASEAKGYAHVALRGEGVCRRGQAQAESEEPLAIWVTASTEQGFETAASLAEDLLADVHEEYRDFCRADGRPAPTLHLRREMRESVGTGAPARAGDLGVLDSATPRGRTVSPAASSGCAGAGRAEPVPGASALWVVQGRPRSARIEVGIEDDASFCVVRRLLGRGGRNTRFIASEAGAGTCVWLLGQGSQRAAERRQSQGPLTVNVGATSQRSLQEAMRLVEELLADVRQEYRSFREARGRRAPGGAGRGE